MYRLKLKIRNNKFIKIRIIRIKDKITRRKIEIILK
jgi:hypothetical protein